MSPKEAGKGAEVREALAACRRSATALPCPFCRAALEPGTAEIHATFLGWLAAGYSRQHLFFAPEGGPEELVLARRSPVPAYRCPSCRAVLLSPA